MNTKKRKIHIVLACVVITASILLFLYTLPSKWIRDFELDKEIVSIDIKGFAQYGYSEATITDKSEIQKLIRSIKKTRTKRRSIFLPIDESDSGLTVLINYNDGTTARARYSGLWNGFIHLGTNFQNMSFKNKKLLKLLLYHLDYSP